VFSSTARLAIWYMCGVTIGVSTLLTSVYLLTQRAMERQVDLVVETEIESLREDYRSGGRRRLIDVLDKRTDDWGRLGAAYLLIDKQGEILAGNLPAWPTATKTAGAWLDFDITVDDQGRAVSHPVRAAVVGLDGNRLLVGTDVSERLRFTKRLRAMTLWGTGLTAALIAITGWWFSRRLAARVRAVAQACDSIISGDLARRLPTDSSADEFDQLAGTVNGMLDRIEQQTAAVRVTFNSAAHDLRAPLYRMRARLETALHGEVTGGATGQALQATLEDLERVQRTLATLLQIAQAEAGGGGMPAERVDLAQMAGELGELYAPEARARGLQLRVHAPAPAIMDGHRQLLAQLLANLLENAIKYVPSGGTIDLRVAVQGARIELSVGDDGPGIPELSQGAMLLPFRRLERDQGAPGSGLGLSLVNAVVRLHHGQLELRSTHPGLRVSCSFACAFAAAPTSAAPTSAAAATVLLAALLLGTAPMGRAAEQPRPMELRDDMGQLLSLPGPPQRIVSLAPGATAMLFAAGGGARIIGTPEYSVEPAAARGITRIGDSHGFDLERILSLHPDLIVAWSGGAAPAQLLPFERAGLPVYHHQVARLDDLAPGLERLGVLLHTEAEAQRAAASLRARISAIRAANHRASAPRLLLQVWDRPVYTLGGGQLTADAAEACGFRNVYAELRDAAPAVSLESIAARDPDVILVLAPDARTAQQWIDHWQALPALRAVRNHRVVGFVDPRLSRMGPETVDATEALCAQLAAAAP
jgi:signal transduction histidine kinase/ABC-type Fe3+-hydroxamate transport system substrate-binding protein